MSQSNHNDFPIAALGASAGGLEAFEKFFKLMPADSGIAFTVVQHLAPDHSSALPELLARHTQMAVEQARDNTKIVPDRVYIIPPNATLTISDRTLRVMEPDEPRGHRTPIDRLFSSLAEDCGENAVCIMLSGTGTDGTLGLRAIKEHGGMAMAQTLESAQYDAILRSAIATGLVDHVLPVEEMPARLLEYAAHLHSLNGKPNGLREETGKHLGKIHSLLRQKAGHDFSQYKESTITRRLERRMRALQIGTVEQYIQVLEGQPAEADQLFKDLLIGVTHFFRDPEAFESLSREVIPKLFESKGFDQQVRVCVVGCASGEEAYSIAILLCEHAATLDNPPKVQIFATDIDERGLEVARKGRYPESVAEHLSAERLERFFIKQEGGYQVTRELRELCIFSSHSFIKDPPFSRLDLISCRNVMIYLGLDLQQKVLPLFHYALRSGGYLFLGPSEHVTFHRELFRTMNKKHRIYQRRETLNRPVKLPLTAMARPIDRGKQPDVDERSLPKELERVILQRYAPACVVVKENGEAVYFSGQISRYLQQPAGSPENNVINMAREGLRTPLRTSLHRAATSRERTIQKQVSIQVNGDLSYVDITVEPLPDFEAANLYMIVLEEAPAGPQQSDVPAATAAEETIRFLESELRLAQEHAQSAYEELETSNEELQSANEEYHSTNEELETSKEEIQSFNEELQTVNNELNRKVSELDHANSDLQNLFDSTQIAAIFLDTTLRIRSFTPAAGGLFRLIAGDVGRPITDLATQFTGTDFSRDIHEVLRTLSAHEQQLAGAGGRHYQMRVLPYRTIHNVIDGVILTFTDVTEAKHAEQLIEAAKTYAENIVETVHTPLLVLDAKARVQSANAAFYDMFQVSAHETLNLVLYDLGGGQWDSPLRHLLGELLPANRKIDAFQVDHDFPAIGRKTMLLNAREIRQQGEHEPLILLAIEDITERRLAEEARRDSEERYRTLFDSCPVGVYSCEASGAIRDFNPRAAELWGRKPKTGDTHERFCGSFKMHRPDGTFMPHGLCPMAEVLSGAIPEARDMEVQIERPDGSWVTVVVNIRALKNGRGEIIGAINCFVDVTERQRIQEELRGLNEDLKHFAYAASHDLQEPLRMVTSYTQLLAKQYKSKLDPPAEQFIAYAVEGAHRMEMLLKGLRDYWAVNEGKIEQNVVADCNRALEEAIAYLQARIEETAAVITHDPLPTVIAEEIALTLLFKNLVGNALKYARPGEPPRIHVSADEISGAWNFSVRDNGIGIQSEYLKNIFAPFKRLHSAEEYPGSGLGLAICQRIIERYGGRIWVESTYGQGSTFRFTIPV
jgi:PAS domain S-box-containing protein